MQNVSGLRLCRFVTGWLALGICWAQAPQAADEPAATFGVTVVAPFGFCGRIYELPIQKLMEPPPAVITSNLPPAMTQAGAPPPAPVQLSANCSFTLPKFEKLQPVGKIYTMRLSVQPRHFGEGFPGVTGRIEWFAIDYSGRFWIESPGKYSFMLVSDDGSALYIDERRVVDNDCVHPAMPMSGSIKLEGGLHDIRVSYFQGPRYEVALVLYVKPPGEKWKIFDMQQFRAPSNPADWKYSNTRNLDLTEDPCKAARPQRGLIQRR